MKTATTLIGVALVALYAAAKTSTPEGWLDDYEAAVKKAAEENKYVVMDFSGSDWCGWCKRLDEEVFATDVFKKGAAEKYVLLMVDSPSDKSLLSPQAARQNPMLVEKFEVHGFPTVVVLDPNGKEVVRTGYKAGGPEKYLRMLDEETRLGPEIKQFIKPMEAVLCRYDGEMDDAVNAALEKVAKKFPEPGKDASAAERRKHKRLSKRYAEDLIFSEVFEKYVPMIEKTIEEARAMSVPEALEERKKELVDDYEQRLGKLKKAIEEHSKAKK